MTDPNKAPDEIYIARWPEPGSSEYLLATLKPEYHSGRPPTIAFRRADLSLPAELVEALNKLPAGPWQVWTSCSYRRISRDADGDVLRGEVHSDGHPDLSWNEEQCQALCDLVNGLRDALASVEGSGNG